MKQWLAEEAQRTGMTITAIHNRLTRKPKKYYPNLKLRRVNKRVVYVTL